MRVPLAVLVVVACASPLVVDDDLIEGDGDVDAALEPLVLDVRTPEEWAQGHLDDARLMPLEELADSLEELDELLDRDRDRPIVVVCGTGRRAEKAREFLRAQGFTHVRNGGAWWACRSVWSPHCSSRGLDASDVDVDVDPARSMEPRSP